MSTPPDTTTRHEYTDEEISIAFGKVPMIAQADTLDLLRAFLAALPERPQAQPGPWPGQQEAIDAAFAACEVTPLSASPGLRVFEEQASDRLAIAQAYDAARPQAVEIAELKSQIDHLEERDRQGREELVRLRAELREARKSEDHWHSEAELLRAEEAKAHAELSALRTPILADDSRSLEAVFVDAFNGHWQANQKPGGRMAGIQAVAAVVLAQAVRRMEAVTAVEVADIIRKIWLERGAWIDPAAEAIRARLLAAARGEGQAKPVVVNETPQDEKQPDLSGEGEKQDEPATKEAPATFQAHGYTWTRHTPGDPMPCDGDVMVHALLSDDMADDPPVQAKNMQWDYAGAGDVIGWRYADEPAQAQQEPAQPWTPENAKAYEDFQAELRETWAVQPWTPAVGDVVRLKSGGPLMVVHYIPKDGSIACTHNINGAFEFATLPTACLTPAKEGQP